MTSGGLWDAIGQVGAAGLSALGLVAAAILTARVSASAARTTSEAQQVVRQAATLGPMAPGECEALVRALSRAYDELRLWARNPVGAPPEPNARVKRFYESGE